MIDKLRPDQIDRLNKVGFRQRNGFEVHTLTDLLETLPDVIEVYRYRPEARWENMSDPTYFVELVISKDEETWRATYGELKFKNPNCCLDFMRCSLLEALYELAISYATAPSEWICK